MTMEMDTGSCMLHPLQPKTERAFLRVSQSVALTVNRQLWNGLPICRDVTRGCHA